MSLFFSNKAVRLVLSISVSIWMAGGCLFGCSNTGMAAESAVPTIEEEESCHVVRPAKSHDCCASQQPKPKKQTTSTAPQPEGLTSFAPTPRGVMQDCPLVTNATAATSKNTTYGPDDPGRAPVAVLPQLQKQTQFVENTLVVPFLPNRGPTHLLCCVFLI